MRSLTCFLFSFLLVALVGCDASSPGIVEPVASDGASITEPYLAKNGAEVLERDHHGSWLYIDDETGRVATAGGDIKGFLTAWLVDGMPFGVAEDLYIDLALVKNVLREGAEGLQVHENGIGKDTRLDVFGFLDPAASNLELFQYIIATDPVATGRGTLKANLNDATLQGPNGTDTRSFRIEGTVYTPEGERKHLNANEHCMLNKESGTPGTCSARVNYR